MIEQVTKPKWAPGVPVKPSSILVIQEVKPGIMPGQVAEVISHEARATVEHLASGTFINARSLASSRGAVIEIACDNLEDAKSIMDAMPLSIAGLMNNTYIPVAPLGQLRTSLRPPPGQGFAR